MRRPTRTVAVLAAVALTVAACGGEEAAPFGTAEVTVEPVSQVISTPATLVARTYTATVRDAARVDVLSPGVATVARLDVTDGMTVAAGQTLGTLRSDALTTSLRSAESTYLAAVNAERSAADALARNESTPPSSPSTFASRLEEVQILLAQATEEAERLRSIGATDDEVLVQLNLIRTYRAEYDAWVRLSDTLTGARASLRSAEQALEQARAAVADLTLVAPVAGTVDVATDRVAGGGRTLTVGSDVTAAQPVVTITAAGGHRIDLTVPETALAPVAVDATVTVELEAYPGVPLTGTVARIVPAPAPTSTTAAAAATTTTTATFVAEVDLADDAGLPLRDGLTGTATLPTLPFPDTFEVTLDVDEVDVVLVTAGQPVTVELDALRGTPLTGEIVTVAATASRSSTGATVYPARVRLDAPDGDVTGLRDGLGGTGDVEVQRLDAPLTVPSTALLRSGGSEVVFVVRDGVAREVPVTVLAFGDLRAAVEGDLTPGERVITTGVERAEDGVAVEVG